MDPGTDILTDFNKMIDSLDYYWNFDQKTRSIIDATLFNKKQYLKKLRNLTDIMEFYL